MARRRRESLLVVAEDPILLRAVPDIVQAELSYLHTEMHTSAVSATSLLQVRAVSILIADVTMHLGSGFLIMAQTAQHSPETPVLAAAPRSQRRLVQQALERGAYDVVWKPVERMDFLKTLRCAIATHRLRQRLKSMETRVNRLQDLLRHPGAMPSHSSQLYAGVIETTRQHAATRYGLPSKAREALEKRLRMLEATMKEHQATLDERLTRVAQRANSRVAVQ